MVRSRKTAANKVKLERSPAKPPSRDGPTQYSAGVVGMGLMGTSISACLLGAGHSLHCVENNAARRRSGRARLLKLLTHAAARRNAIFEADTGPAGCASVMLPKKQ